MSPAVRAAPLEHPHVAGAPSPAPRSAAPPRDDLLAGRLALTGAALGVLAGLVELTVGASVRDWVGDKQDTTRLGLTTVLLALVATAAAGALRRPHAGHRVAIALALLLPAVVCFTTVGRLWWIPGPLLLAAVALVVAATGRDELAAVADAQHWRRGLLLLCGAFFVFLGAVALGGAGALGVLGGVLIWSVPRAAARSAWLARGLLVAGALPFAAATWWSVVTPLVAVTALVLGLGVIRAAATR